MRYLLDTHIALWWADGSERLSEKARRLIECGSNEIQLSVVSVWEASIKSAAGKLELPGGPLSFFQALVERSQFTVLPVHLSHAASVYSLPRVHCDPFDRLLISDDSIFEKYDLPGLIR